LKNDTNWPGSTNGSSFLKNYTDDTNKHNEWNIEELMPDLVAIAVACQLLGLQDAISDPSFTENGGWLQPLNAPTTLPVLVTRFSANSIAWAGASFIVQGYTENKDSKENYLADGLGNSPVSSIVGTAMKTAVFFIALRLALTLAIFWAAADLSDGLGSLELDQAGLARECYNVAVVVTAARYIQCKLYLM